MDGDVRSSSDELSDSSVDQINKAEDKPLIQQNGTPKKKAVEQNGTSEKIASHAQPIESK